MAECIDCGKSLDYRNSMPNGRCSGCHGKYLAANNKTASDGSTSAATAFTSLAWVIVTLTFVCTLIATFVTAVDGDPVSAMMMFIGGCFSAVLLGLLTEISTNIAKLVNNSR